MTDVHGWAELVVNDLSEQDIVDIVANGAEGFLANLGREVPPGLDEDDRAALVVEVERVCRARVLPPD